jgi:hypothetical protein
MVPKNHLGGRGMNWRGSREEKVAGSCEGGNKPSISTKYEEVII